MAEGWTRVLQGDLVEVYSAGTVLASLNQRAVRVMAEVGIDISGHYPKTIEMLDVLDFDLVITVCDHAAETCPVFPAKAKVVHRGFPDPPHLTKDMNEEEALMIYRTVRDDMKAFVISELPVWLASLTGK
jgi:arsenate reductase